MRRTLRSWFFHGALATLVAFFLIPSCKAQFANPSISPSSAISIPQANLIQPEALHPMLQSKDKPLILQVGSRIMFAQAQIPGAQYGGPGSQPAGRQLLERKVAASPKNGGVLGLPLSFLSTGTG